MIVGMSKINSFVLELWRISPFTKQRMAVSEISISSFVTAHGPIGQNVSCDFPISHWLCRPWRSRAVTSLTMV